jgi:hypothetical protein
MNSKRSGWAWYGTKTGNAYRILVGKHLSGKLKRQWMVNIKMELVEID